MTFSNSSYRHLLKVFLPDISRAIAVYLGFHLHRLSFSISSLSLCVSLKLKWCTCREHISSVQSLSRFQLFVTPWIAACQASLSIANSLSSLRLMSIESVMPSSHLILCHPLLLLPSLFQWVNPSHEVAKVLEFQLQHHSFQRNPRADLIQKGLVESPCSSRASQESSPTPQFKNINSSVLSFLHSATLTSIHDYWKKP